MYEKINSIFYNVDETTDIHIFDKNGINNFLSDMYNNLNENKIFNISDYLNLTYYFNVKMYNAFNTGTNYIFVVWDDMICIIHIQPNNYFKFKLWDCFIHDDLSIYDIDKNDFVEFDNVDTFLNYVKNFEFGNFGFCFPNELINDLMEQIKTIVSYGINTP